MDLLDRYLRAVRAALPARERDDITRELRENLLAQLEDREEQLGRPLTAPEQRAFLAAFGHPLSVAERFRADRPTVAFGRELIGPMVFPFYLRVLSISVLLATTFSLLALLIEGATWTVGGVAGRIALPLTLSFVSVTAVFVVIDRWIARNPIEWDPEQELPLADLTGFGSGAAGSGRGRVLARLGAVAELAVVGLGLGLWLAFSPPASIGDLEPGPGWTQLYVPVIVATLLSAVAPLLALLRPERRRLAGMVRIAADSLLLALMAWSLSLGQWVQPAGQAPLPADQERFMGLINTGVTITLAIAVVVQVLTILDSVRKLRHAA